jgi:hypothetical protein
MKYVMLFTTLISAFLLSSCSKEKQTEKMLYGEWEVKSFLHGANDLTQLYKDSCGCRLMFQDNYCLLKCPFNDWNYYYSDSLANFPWRNHQFQYTSYVISENMDEISWYFGYLQPDSIYHWGMYPLTISIYPGIMPLGNKFVIQKLSDNIFIIEYNDSSNIPYLINLKKLSMQ